MKNLISTLLHTIAVFLQFSEFNATGNQEAVLPIRLHIPGRKFVQIDLADGKPDIKVKFGDVDVLLWLDSNRTGVRKAFHKNCYIPIGVFYRHNDFLIRTITLDGFRLVAYKAKDNELIGIRAPKHRDQYYALEPTPSEWYINYLSTHFRLEVNVTSYLVTAIHLKPFNLHRKGQIPSEHAKVAGISFWVFRGSDTKIIGAQLA